MHAGETLTQIWAALFRPSALAELAVLVACVLLAWGLVRLLRRRTPSGVWLGKRAIDGALFPLLALLLVVVARMALAKVMPIGLLRLAVPILASLAIIRTLARVLSEAFPQSAAVRAFARTLSWLVWLGMVLWITDLLPMLIDSMEEVKWRIGGSTISLLAILQGALTALVALLSVLWLSTLIEARLMRASRVNLSVRKIAANATRALLMVVGTLVALSAAGIPLTALSVLGGAIGVGIGLGLQKLAANYVSGFVILAERSLRIGDTVKVDGFEGRITDITTRYTVVRALNGRESLVPNEMMITQRVENATLADPRVALSTTVQVAYGTDLDRLLPKLTEAVHAVPRVLADPPSGVLLSNFAADGLELTIVFWIGDIENGTGGVRSDVNLAVLRCLNGQGVEIPYPQRVVRQA
ncbi:MAG TPA: mechanosensitive ion channel domain-containing protein [Burkholderiaceae bacterium]|nr:mechanosensitive ion channel domain-containing protein [Burkholderiaceae bacterium]